MIRSPDCPTSPSSNLLIFLIGPRGSGKTTAAQLVARELGWDWLDADNELETRYGRSIRDIFESEGEAGFRAKEAAILRDVCRLSRHIIATGGGVVLRESNRALLRASGRVIWLTADVDTLWQRVQADGSTLQRRPPLSVGGRAEMEEIIEIREPLYRQCADLIVETAGRTPGDIVAEILRWVQQAEPRP